MLGLLGAGGAGLVAGGVGGAAVAAAATTDAVATAAERLVYPFFGAHQGGITTPVQEHLHIAAFDMADGANRDDIQTLLQDWSYAASRMTQGLDVTSSGALGGDPQAPPDDTGEAIGTPANGLTITIGLGPTLFRADGVDRFGLAVRAPEDLVALPRFVGDDLNPRQSYGDLCIQACANDPQVAVHAIRNLTRIAFGRAAIRWSQLGFGRTSRTTSEQSTPRNLFGYKDGTANILADDTGALKQHVWVGEDDGPSWLAGGTYLVVRKIAMTIELWDRQRLAEQDRIFGRNKGEGAPLSGGDEFTPPDFAANDATGAPAIDPDSHVRLAHPSQNDGIRLLRRGYNFVDGNSEIGQLAAGLLFLSFQRSPEQFIAVQRRLAASDLMNEYVRHVGSSVWAVPPGVEDGGYIGSGLFD
ncbi:deferrochelatase/peroxidase EfeB [Microbacterium sp. SLBN-146]|nr:deferrochelatase/peroxidase EfeB [Microbacterium sp. SLBN-146]